MTEEKSEAFPVAFVNPRSADNYVVGIVGTIGSGKSHLAMMLIKMWKFKFDIVVWISPTFQFQDMSMIRDTTGIVLSRKPENHQSAPTGEKLGAEKPRPSRPSLPYAVSVGR
jgi:ABC-type dipeptide/oligopeptide/nickel transport system ATPase component